MEAPRGVRGSWGSVRGCRGVRGALGAGRECRSSGTRRGIGGIRGHLGNPRGVGGIEDHQGVGGVRGALEVAGGLGAWPHWAPVQGSSTPTGSLWGVTYLTKARQGPLSRVPSLPMVSVGEWPTWPRPSKWQKWALQALVCIWNYILWQFAYLYLCCLIIYSYMQCKEMLYELCSLQTMLCISLHHQSDILWHNGTNYKELLFSSSIWVGFIWLQMSSWPYVVVLCAFLMCNVVVATTKLQSNNKNNNKYNNNNKKSWSLEVFSGTVHWFLQKTSFQPLLWSSSGLMKTTVVVESLSSAKPMYCSREYFKTSRLIQQYEKSTLNITKKIFSYLSLNRKCM